MPPSEKPAAPEAATSEDAATDEAVSPEGTAEEAEEEEEALDDDSPMGILASLQGAARLHLASRLALEESDRLDLLEPQRVHRRHTRRLLQSRIESRMAVPWSVWIDANYGAMANRARQVGGEVRGNILILTHSERFRARLAGALAVLGCEDLEVQTIRSGSGAMRIENGERRCRLGASPLIATWLRWSSKRKRPRGTGRPKAGGLLRATLLWWNAPLVWSW